MRKVSGTFKIVLLVCVLSWPGLVFSQPPPFEDYDCVDANNAEDVPCPLDGGVSLLVASGIAFGLKKAHEKKKTLKVLNK